MYVVQCLNCVPHHTDLEEDFALPKGVIVTTILCTSTKTPERRGKTESFLYHRTHESMCEKRDHETQVQRKNNQTHESKTNGSITRI